MRAYTRHDYTVAAEALAKSQTLEPDPDTLYVLAQAERKLDHCDRAIPMYEQLMQMRLPGSRHEVIAQALAECRQIVGAPPEPAAQPPAPDPSSQPEPEPAPAPAPHADPPPQPAAAIELPSPPPVGPHDSAWWSDPVGDTLLGAGLVGIGVGVGFLAEAYSADQDRSLAKTYPEYLHDSDRATTYGQIGIVALSAGGVLATSAAVWFATHRDSRPAPVTGWIAPGGGGFALTGRF